MEPALRHPEHVSALVFAPDGNLLATGCEDGLARIWDMISGTMRCGPLEHPYAVAGLAFSPDGKTLLTWDIKNNLRLWDVRSGKPMGSALPHGGVITAAAFSPDNQSVAIASGRNAYLWDAVTGHRVGPLLLHPEPVMHVSFDPGGAFLATICEDGLVRFFDRPRPAVGNPALVKRWIEALTGRALAESGTFTEFDPTTLLKHRRNLMATTEGEPFPLP
jgi:WD40 repeat protein